MNKKNYKKLDNCCTDLDTLIALDKRAEVDLKNNTHNIGQEEVITIIREFIRLKNDVENLKIKDNRFAIVLAILVGNEIQKIIHRDISSATYELIEELFKKNQLSLIEELYTNIIKDKRTVEEIIEENEN